MRTCERREIILPLPPARADGKIATRDSHASIDADIDNSLTTRGASLLRATRSLSMSLPLETPGNSILGGLHT
jgi:hypothetical protein